MKHASFFFALALTAYVPACASSPPPAAAPATSAATSTKESPAAPAAKSLYSFEAKDIDGQVVHLDRYKGKVALVVNVASECGYTPQYPGLQALYERHVAEGFVVLGFPSNQFGHQEPGTEAEIKTFCTTRYAVTFPLFAKIDVNGPAAHPLYVWLRAEQPGHLDKDTAAAIGAAKLYAHLAKSTPEVLGTDAIKWNFTKFLVDRQGHVVKRFESPQTPESIEPEVVALLKP